MPTPNKSDRPDLSYRTLAVATVSGGAPATLDEATRSVEVIGATENPVTMYDYDRWEYVPEILLMSGCRLPASGQVPLLDSHSRYETSSVLGSYRGMLIQAGQLLGRACYSSAPEAEGPWTKTKEGHLTDYSVGYRVNQKTYIPDGQTGIIGGRTYTGPVNVVTDWTPREMSVCPIGADELAKARAATPSIPRKEEAMHEKLRKYLERRGLPVDATEEQAWSYLDGLDSRQESAPAKPAQIATPARSEDEIRADAARAENSRITEITAMCDQFAIPAEERAEMVKPGVSLDQARKQVLDRLKEQNKPAGHRGAIETGADERDKFRAAAIDSLCLRGGLSVDAPAAGATDIRGFSLRELARETLRVSGQSVSGSPMEMIGRSLTTSDLPNILANVANKFLYEGYGTNQETWQTWCATGQVSDFKTNTLVRASETDDLDQISELGEYVYGNLTEAKEQYAVATYGKLFAISRQAIINDDLGALTDIPRKHGEAASRKIGDIAYAVLTANAAMGDSTALFHANHANLGTAGVPSVTTIGEAAKLMALQKDIKGKRRLNIRPQFFVAPVTLQTACEVFFQSNLIGTQAAPNQANIFTGNYFQRVYEARLDDSSTTAWYLAGPRGKTVTVFFLNGNQSPYLETKEGWNIDGVEYKVRIDAGAKAVDWKAMVKNAGA